MSTRLWGTCDCKPDRGEAAAASYPLAYRGFQQDRGHQAKTIWDKAADVPFASLSPEKPMGHCRRAEQPDATFDIFRFFSPLRDSNCERTHTPAGIGSDSSRIGNAAWRPHRRKWTLGASPEGWSASHQSKVTQPCHIVNSEEIFPKEIKSPKWWKTRHTRYRTSVHTKLTDRLWSLDGPQNMPNTYHRWHLLL